MRVASAVFAAIFLVGAPAASQPRPSGSTASVTLYTCRDGATVRARYPDAVTAVIRYRGRIHRLKSATSADGVRYVGDGLQWWTKGLTRGAISPLPAGETYARPGVECVAPKP
ncbi:MAG: MliC family protein [Caulobacteraceae bacterium]|nr:MliC family protein [Caulobacteraceae bacterium]